MMHSHFRGLIFFFRNPAPHVPLCSLSAHCTHARTHMRAYKRTQLFAAIPMSVSIVTLLAALRHCVLTELRLMDPDCSFMSSFLSLVTVVQLLWKHVCLLPGVSCGSLCHSLSCVLQKVTSLWTVTSVLPLSSCSACMFSPGTFSMLILS